MPIPADHINYLFSKTFSEGTPKFALLDFVINQNVTTNDITTTLLNLDITTTEVVFNSVTDGIEFSITKSITSNISGVRSWVIYNPENTINRVFYYDNYDRTYDIKTGSTVTVSGKSYY